MGDAKTDLLQGTLDLIVLRLLRSGPANGWDITQSIQVVSKGALEINYGSVYPALRRLEARGFVSRRLEKKTFVYEATMAPKRVAAHSVRQIIERFWSGSAEQFLTGMVDEKVLTPAEIASLARKIAHAKRRRNTDA